MGLDVNLYADGEVSDEELAAAEAFMQERCADMVWDQGKSLLKRCGWVDNRVELNTLSRYYGPGYERGNWPAIHNAIVCLGVALPSCTIHYGSDSDFDAPEVTVETLNELWAHYLGPDGCVYRARVRAFNAAQGFT